MALNKCNKYITKLANTPIEHEKFGLYLDKLNYWYDQTGGVMRAIEIQAKAAAEAAKKIEEGITALGPPKECCARKGETDLTFNKYGDMDSCNKSFAEGKEIAENEWGRYKSCYNCPVKVKGKLRVWDEVNKCITFQ